MGEPPDTCPAVSLFPPFSVLRYGEAHHTTPHHTSEVRQIDAGLVVCSIDSGNLTEENTQRIHLIPVDANGMVAGVDGRRWKYNAENILAAAASMKIDYPGDYHHASINAQKTGAKAPACGWIKPSSLSADPDGIWGEVEWTGDAANEIRKKEFKYISPVFTAIKATGETLAFKGFALTHYPNLDGLTPVANAKNLEDEHMDELLERIKHLLNLPELATPEEILAELEKAVARLSAAISSESSEAVNAQETTLDDLLTQLDSRITTLAANSQEISGDDFVPRSEFDRVKTQLETITSAADAKRVETAVNSAIAAGKIAPANKEWAEGYCRENPEGFEQLVANSAQAVPLGEDTHKGEKAADALSDEEVAMCSQLGIAQADYIKSKQEEVN